MAYYNASGQMNLTVVDGTDYVGRQATDGSTHIVLNDGSAYTGFAHPSGAINAVVVTDNSSTSNPNGSMNVIAIAEDVYVPVGVGNPVSA